MQNLLVLLGKRIHGLRVAKGWSQEEFANVSGFHRTYVGQIERGEKNLSFDNLVKVAAALELTASELLSVLDGGDEGNVPKKLAKATRTDLEHVHRAHEMQKLLLRLRHQRDALDRTLTRLEELMAGGSQSGRRPRDGKDKRPTRKRGSLAH